FRGMMEHPELFEGSDVGCLAVGLSTAYLFTNAKVARVATALLTKEAERALEEAGIAVAAEERIKLFVAPKLARGTPEPDPTPRELAEFDQLARDAGTVGRFLDELRQRFA